MNKVVVVGMVGDSIFMNVDHFHEGGETLHAASCFSEPGGKGFNQAIAAARAGADVTFISAIGNDGFRSQAENFLRKDSIHPVFAEKDGRSALAFILTDRSGTNHVTVYPGVCLCAGDVPAFENALAQADVLLLNNEVPEDVNYLCASQAGKSGAKVVYNPAPYRQLSPEMIAHTDLFTPNEYETAGLEECPNCIVTLGERGCLYRLTGRHYPAVRVVPVDTTGAGDTFSGVLAAMLAGNKSVEEAIMMAGRAAAVSVTRKGAAGSIPYLYEYQ